jgi:hypothetical protein
MGGNDSITSHSAHEERCRASRPRKPAEQAEHHADDDRQQHRDDAHHHRDARAVDHGREDVAALVVGAEQVFGRALRRPAGGRRESLSSSVARSKGLCGDTQPANAAQNMQAKRDSAAAMATGEVRKL